MATFRVSHKGRIIEESQSLDGKQNSKREWNLLYIHLHFSYKVRSFVNDSCSCSREIE